MAALHIYQVAYDVQTRMLNFSVRATTRSITTTVVSSIHLPVRPRSSVAARWAIMQRLHEVDAFGHAAA